MERITIGVLLCMTVSVSDAQMLYTRDSKITVTEKTTITVRGSVENEGTISNHGHIKVSGPWINSGLYVPGDGEITFNSNSRTIPQIIHHNGQKFNKVTIAGGTKKIILSDFIVAGEIRFAHGIIEAAGKAGVIFDSGARINGASDSSHVHGVTFHKGEGHKIFPIGNGSTYLPVELPEVHDPAAFIGVQAFEFDNIELAKTSTLKSISNNRYWFIDVVSGSIPDSPVILPLDGEAMTFDSDKVVVVQSASPTEAFESIGGSMATNSSARSSGRIKSEMNVSLPFIALATAAAEINLIVYNAVSRNGDGLNDFLTIENIELFPSNKIAIFNRWGDKVFELENYDNQDRVFKGRANVGGDSDLVTGTYFYVLDIQGEESMRGFIAVKN